MRTYYGLSDRSRSAQVAKNAERGAKTRKYLSRECLHIARVDQRNDGVIVYRVTKQVLPAPLAFMATPKLRKFNEFSNTLSAEKRC